MTRKGSGSKFSEPSSTEGTFKHKTPKCTVIYFYDMIWKDSEFERLNRCFHPHMVLVIVRRAFMSNHHNNSISEELRYKELLEKELKRMVSILGQLGAEKVILFGSYARGVADLFTDIDLIVIMNSNLPFVERTAGIYRELTPRVASDILVYSPQEWSDMQDHPFIQKALREGKLLYEKITP